MVVSFFHRIARVNLCQAVFEGRIPVLKKNKIPGAVPEKKKISEFCQSRRFLYLLNNFRLLKNTELCGVPQKIFHRAERLERKFSFPCRALDLFERTLPGQDEFLP